MSERETYSVCEITAAFTKWAREDEWGVPSFYLDSLIAALRGEYDTDVAVCDPLKPCYGLVPEPGKLCRKHAAEFRAWREDHESTPERVPGPASLPVHLGRKGDPIFTECDIDRANARRWTWNRDDVTCEKCLSRTSVIPPATTDQP